MTDHPTIGHIGFGPLSDGWRQLLDSYKREALAYEKALVRIRLACVLNLENENADHTNALEFVKSLAALAINTAGNSEYREGE